MMTTTVKTVVGDGTAGCSDSRVNDPFGLVIGPDGALYFCEVGNHRIRRLDLQAKTIATVAGNGERGYAGNGGPATGAAMNMPHELCFDPNGNIYVVERDSHAVRKIDRATGTISAVAGTGEPGFSGDGGPATEAQLRIPHSIAFDGNGDLLICDIGNHRIRRLVLATGTIDTYAGTGETLPTPDGAPLAGTPLNGPRTIVVGSDGSLYLALREGNQIYRLDPAAGRIEHLAGTGEKGFSGDGGPAVGATLAGPKGLAYGADGTLYIADTENHAIRAVNLATRTITTVLGTGERGDGPETSPLACKMSRPHGLWADQADGLYVADSETHRIRLLTA
jgi:DNA-binding beta-propeller fold protein YncE